MERQDNLAEEILMLLPFNIEEICMTSTTQFTRAKVPGGWLVYALLNAPRGNVDFTCSFVADPEWQWEVK